MFFHKKNKHQRIPNQAELGRHPSLTHSLTRSLSHSHSLSLTLTLTHFHSLTSLTSLTHSLTHSLTPSLPHSLTPSLPHSLTPSLPHSLTPSLPHSLTPSLPHSLTHSLTHSLNVHHVSQFFLTLHFHLLIFFCATGQVFPKTPPSTICPDRTDIGIEILLSETVSTLACGYLLRQNFPV